MMKLLLPLIILLVGVSVLWQWTLGFSAFTSYSYTLAAAGQLPRNFPEVEWVNQDGQPFWIGEKQKYVLVNFVYLNCPNVCHKVNNQMEQIYHSFDSATVPAQLEFVTISFDLQHDDIRKIKKYRSYFGSDIDGWNFALPYRSTPETFGRYLRNIGVWKYTNPATGIINHSIYLFLVTPDHHLVKVFDPARDNNAYIVEEIKSCLRNWQKQ